MRLPSDALIAEAKLTDYLLAYRQRNDKSKWLGQAGYTIDNWRTLENDLGRQMLPLEGQVDENNAYGIVYRIEAELVGPNGRSLSLVTIWMTEHETGRTKFITLYPK